MVRRYRDEELLDITSVGNIQSTQSIPTPQTDDAAIFELLMKASTQPQVSHYDSTDITIHNKEITDVNDTEGIRRAIHTISNYYNTLGVWRDDFDKLSNDRLARNAYYSMCEKAMMDYMGSIEYKIVDSNGESVEAANEFLDQPNNQESFDILLKTAIRDLIRYDAGVWVKSFNKAGYLTEIKSYLGTEFWKEIDRVPMAVNIPKDYVTSGANMYQGWWSHGYTYRYWQRSRTGVYIPFQPEEITYFMMYPRTDGIYGTDFMKFLKHQLQYLIDSTRAAGKTFENGIVPSIVWEHPDVMSREQLAQRIRKVEVENKGSYKFGGIIHTVNNEKVTTLAQTLHSMDWLEGQKFVAQLIWAMWGFSPSEFIGEGENRACYSEDTEVLTENGWKLHKDILPDEKIAIYDTKLNECRLEVPKELMSYCVNEELVRFKTNAQDILVTKEHTILKGKYWKKDPEWSITQAKELIGRRISVKSATENWRGNDTPTNGDYLKFLGWCISEGGLSSTEKEKGRYYMTLAQSNNKSENVAEIRRVLNSVCERFHEYQNTTDNTTRWNVYGEELLSPLFDLIGSHCDSKKIPRYCLNLSKDKLEYLFDALMAGDGCWDGRDNRSSGYYCTTSNQLADDFQELAFKLGYGTKKSTLYSAYGNKKTCYRVSIKKNLVREIQNPKLEHYSGIVYCFSTSTGFYITRRNGCVAVQGNTAYVKRNITKSRLLYPLMKHFAGKINKEVLPYLKGYRQGWRFEFIRDVDLDDEQKVAQTQAIKVTTFNTLVSMGVKPSVSLRVSGLDDGMTKPEIEELDQSLEMMAMGLEGSMDETTEGGLPTDEEAGRYGNGSESYVDASLSADEGASKPTEAPRSAEEEERQFKKAMEPLQGVTDDHVEFFRDFSEGILKAKVYINYPSEAPPGRHVGRGARGGYYYITNVREKGATSGADEGKQARRRKRKKAKGWGGGGRAAPEEKVSIPPPPDLGGHQLKIVGKGVGLVISLIGDKIRAKKLDNGPTNAFVKRVIQCGEKDPKRQFDCAKALAQKLELKVLET